MEEEKERSIKKLAHERLALAKENIEAAELLFKNKKLRIAVSRTYYAVFYAARALLATMRKDTKHTQAS